MIQPLLLAASLAATPASMPPSASAFLTFESGVLAGVNWVDRTGTRLHSRSVLTQSCVIDATIDLREDQSESRSTTVLAYAGSEPMEPVERTAGDGTIFWSDMSPSSIEQAVLRARVLNRPSATLEATSLFRTSHDEVRVTRVDSTDWVVTCHNKRYEVLTDAAGRMLSATLPEYGVTIERREGFGPDRYPLWPPDGAPPDSAYRAGDVTIRAPEGHTLAGTLTTPRGRGPFPAAVLITGLSPSNRDGGQPPWMPLRDIADALTRRGIAVLRVDDRGVGSSTGDRATSTTFDEANDVETEAAWLRARPGIDHRRIALVGYSEGGLIAPMVAARDASIAAIVTLAGPGVPGPEVARYQIEAAVVRDSSIAASDREAEIRKQLADTLTVRERSYLSIEPMQYAKRTRCPALILQGGTDLHVPLRSPERLAWAMRSGGNSDVTVRVVPGVSHSLLNDPLGLNSGWVYLPGFVTSPVVLDAAGDWLAAHLGAGRGATEAKR